MAWHKFAAKKNGDCAVDGNGELCANGMAMFASMNAENLLQACRQAGVPSEVIAHIERHKDVIANEYAALASEQEPTTAGAKAEEKK